MKKFTSDYLYKKFDRDTKFFELASGANKFLAINEIDYTVIEVKLNILEDAHKNKYVSNHQLLDQFSLPIDTVITRDKFFLSINYSLNGKRINIHHSDRHDFENLLIRNNNSLKDTNRKFRNKIFGFRSQKRRNMIIATIMYLCTFSFIVNVISNDTPEKTEIQDKQDVVDKKIKNSSESKGKKDDIKMVKNKKDKTSSHKEPIQEVNAENEDNQGFDAKEDPKELKPGTTDRLPVTLSSTVDGDTAKFNYNRKVESFRFLLIDTPETKHPRKGKQPYGQEASERTAQLLQNANKIEVEFDVGQKKDKYQRNLAYIYVDGQMINEILVREGLAKVAYVYPPNTRYLDKLEKAQSKAKEEKLGVWSIDSAFEEDNTIQSNTTNKNNTNQETAKNTINDAANSQSNTDSTNNHNSESYKNCTELRKVYPRGVPAGHPAYEPKHDRDKDGYACEVN